MLELDHLAISAATLEDGATTLEAALGVAPGGGGRHAAFGTHNRLLSLGPAEYLEVIAIDPAGPPPGRPRWFGLDAFAGAPRLTTWILRCDDLDAALARLPGAGAPLELSRGAYRWRMAVPAAGALPFDGVHPALIQWLGPTPAPALPEAGCRLTRLTVCHPRAGDLAALLALADQRIVFAEGPAGLRAEVATPAGPRSLP
jgi:hypothetical protein